MVSLSMSAPPGMESAVHTDGNMGVQESRRGREYRGGTSSEWRCQPLDAISDCAANNSSVPILGTKLRQQRLLEERNGRCSRI